MAKRNFNHITGGNIYFKGKKIAETKQLAIKFKNQVSYAITGSAEVPTYKNA